MAKQRVASTDPVAAAPSGAGVHWVRRKRTSSPLRPVAKSAARAAVQGFPPDGYNERGMR
jgi:hypothetical protein